MDITLEHVRSFSKKCSVSLRPLTLLVGENSSGKSTFLSVVSSVLDASRFPFYPGFNDPPYSLGTFDTIATYRGGKYGRDDRFSIGFSVDEKGAKEYRSVTATYGRDYGNVVLRRVGIANREGTLDVNLSENSVNSKVHLSASNGKPEIDFEFERELTEATRTSPSILRFFALDTILSEARRSRRTALRREGMARLFALVEATAPPYPSSFNFAPIRSKPRRTYDELSEEYSPEGDHIPTLLARLLRQEPNSSESQRVRTALLRFGKESGLFKNINVKKLGKNITDPFQLQVAAAGPPVNLADVGYGVSQALPIIVQSVLKTTSNVLLMQQPEVHLHPRAQAALGSFFAELAAKDDRVIVMETHSDYLIDRVRQEVARGTISSDRVLINFFDKPKLDTNVYPIALDENGNIQNAPREYREFFLQEEMNLFSRTEA